MSINKKFTIGIFFAVLISAVVVAYFYRYLPVPVLREGQFEISAVDRGPVIETVPAQGVVEPQNEVLLLSPASSIVQKIVNDVGSKVHAGDVIMRLDTKSIMGEIEDMQDQLEVKQNNLDKTLLNSRNIRVDLDYNVEVKKLAIASLKSQLADEEQLLDVGGISPAKIDKTKQELTLAEKDLETLKQKNAIRLEQLNAEEKGLRLQITIQMKELEERKSLLNKMIIKAPSDGIILEINGKEGEKVDRDRLLVRMSDLSTFKIRASIEDKMDSYVKTGEKVFVIIDSVHLKGKIGTISPVVRDRKIEFDVFLDQNSYSKLRPNLNVDLQVVSAQRDSVLRVKKGPAFTNEQNQDIYEVENNMAVMKNIKTGLRGNQYIELLSGAEVGDQLITSDITSLRKQKEIEIQK